MDNKITKRTLITSALPYANGHIHLGHCAGAYLPADLYARYLRLRGKETLYICGSDEHGVAITIAADKENTSPKQIIDKYHYANKEAFEKLGISFDIYSRTSLPEHHETAREFFADFLKKGYLIEKSEEQFYDPKSKMFLPDRYVEGICPNCGYDKARGDQCDNCGAYYNQLELKNPISLLSGETPEVKKTVHWYLQFNKFQEFLENYIETHSKDWKENVLQQTRSWLKQGLTERAITRDLTWGVSIEGIPGIKSEAAGGKVLYVWFDAVLGYITATKTYYLQQNAAQEWTKWWKDNATRYIAFIGKDNIVFHTLIFPAMLHARGDNYILPDNVPANEFLNLEGQKFSKSRNWSIDLRDFLNEFPDSNYIDSLRYTLGMSFPETRDSDFTWRDYQARNNNELADILGNFINRTAHFIGKQFDSIIPALSGKYKALHEEWDKVKQGIVYEELNLQALSKNDFDLIQSLQTGYDKIISSYENFKFRDAISETMNIARAANKYFNDEEPWKTLKSDKEYCAKTMFVCANLVNSLALLFAPILPHTAIKIFAMSNFNIATGEPGCNPNKIDYISLAMRPTLPVGSKFTKPELLFTKIEDSLVETQIAKLGQLQTTNQKSKKENEENEKINLITIDDVKKVQLRTALVLQAEKIEKSKKLLRLQIDTGADKRQIVAGIAEHYKPEDLVGKIVVVVFNLQPAKLMNNESQGMLLAANSTDGKLSIVTVDDSAIGTGAEVR